MTLTTSTVEDGGLYSKARYATEDTWASSSKAYVDEDRWCDEDKYWRFLVFVLTIKRSMLTARVESSIKLTVSDDTKNIFLIIMYLL